MERPFKFDEDYAIFLAEEVIRQFHEYPLAIEDRVKLNREKLAEVLMTAEGLNHAKRMQFRIPKNEGNRFNEYGSFGHLIGFFYPRRITANYNTDYKPTRTERLEQRTEEALWGRKKLTFSSRVICRKMREDEDISLIRARSLKEGHGYGVMIHFSTSLQNLEEPPHHGGDTEVHTPLIFIPGAKKEDLDIMAKFCITHQNPEDEEIRDYTKHGIFKDYLYPEQRKKL